MSRRLACPKCSAEFTLEELIGARPARCSTCNNDRLVYDDELEAAVPCPSCRPDEHGVVTNRRPSTSDAPRIPVDSHDRRELEETP